MKNLFIGLFLIVISLTCHAQEDGAVYKPIGTGITNVTASVTNTVVGEIFQIYHDNSPFRIWAKAEGTLAATNGVSVASNIVFRVSTASGNLQTTNTFDTAGLSSVKLTIPMNGFQTNIVSDWFQLSGSRYFRVGAIENNTLGTVSNVQIIVGYPK